MLRLAVVVSRVESVAVNRELATLRRLSACIEAGQAAAMPSLGAVRVFYGVIVALRADCLFLLPVTALSGLVALIVLIGPNKKVRWIYARRHVAAMANMQRATGYGTVDESPNEAVGLVQTPIKGNESVASGEDFPGPNPATVRVWGNPRLKPPWQAGKLT